MPITILILVSFAGSIALTVDQVYGDFSEGKYYSSGARATVAGIAYASTFIPVYGWLIAGGYRTCRCYLGR